MKHPPPLVPGVVACQVLYVNRDAQADGGFYNRVEHGIEIGSDGHGHLDGDLEQLATVVARQVGDGAQPRDADSSTTTTPANVPAISANSLRFQLPSWKRTTSASDATTPALSRPMMVNTSSITSSL